MRAIPRVVLVVALLAAAAPSSAQSRYDVVHTFSGVEAPRVPRNLILAADGNFYGISSYSGSAAIARLTPAGRISIVHALSAAEGTAVTALLQASDGNFYGATSDGGASGVGTIFRMTPAGTFTIVHHFSGRLYPTGPGDNDGARPQALLQASDGNFYGVTSNGGSTTEPYGTFFKMTAAGTVSILHSFTLQEPSLPSTLMQAADGSFYGGNYDKLFKITPAGALTVLTSVSWLSPPSTLVEGADGNFYGTTTTGFCVMTFCSTGRAFKLSPGGQVTVLHTFARAVWPNGPLVQAGGAFYGTTDGTVFKMTSTGDVTVLHTFTGSAEEGSGPSRLVRSSDGSLYGTTYSGGTLSLGAMFRLAPDDTFSRIATSFSDGPADGAIPTAALLEGADGNFYGTTSAGGTFGLGTIFKLTRDGSMSVLHNFAGGADGAGPYAALIQATDGNFYGTTYYGGGNANVGTIFQMTAGGAVTIVHRFAGGTEGAHPYAPVIQAADGSLYGTTFGSFAVGAGGTIFRMPLGGPVTTVRRLDANAEGVFPYAALVQGTDGNFYGSTTRGLTYTGTSFNGYGTIFRMTPDGAVTVLYAFGLLGDGAFPYGALVQGSDGNFYGATTLGGATYGGTIFRITPEGRFTVLHSLDTSTEGSSPEAPLLQAADGNLYGVTRYGAYTGTATAGTIFRFSPAGVFALVHTFASADGTEPAGGLIQTRDWNLYGTTTRGGAAGVGVVFRLAAIRTVVETPAQNQRVNATFTVTGWAIDSAAASGTGIDAIHVYAYPDPGSNRLPVGLGAASYGIARPDIGGTFGTQFLNSGFTLSVSSGLAPGRYAIAAYAHSTVTNAFVFPATTVVTLVGSDPAMALDGPRPNATTGRTVTIAGWAIDRGAISGTGIDAIHVWAYPQDGGDAQFVGVAAYGGSRPDVGAIFGAQFTNSGYRLAAQMSAGTYTIVAFAHSTIAGTFNAALAASGVNVLPTDSNPAMFIDAPGQATTATRPFTIAGWVVDQGAAAGTGIDAVHVWAVPTNGTAATPVGVATYGVFRPDIGVLFQDTRFINSGYTLTVTSSMLAAGSYDLVVFGHSTVTNGFTVARVVRVTVQ